ncbi:endonuclease/exonuclease/phosphatase family protein [Salinicoccus sp. HZC-1]|uniref:endonuclease/exonuclease/phosphatase family protein n=1 Tax=Salinicoccus sp. HZC-1 TaxID=3385497 RepID=UPI00398B76C8
MKKIIVFSVLSMFILLSFSPGTLANGYGKQISIDVMSYNIYHGVGEDEELNLERIADVIRDADAEIIGLQEVDRYYGERSDFEDQAKELADLLGYHYMYGANLELEPEGNQENNRQYGNAILSKYPIIESENIALTSDGEQRGVQQTKINVRGVHVNVYNTHLGLDEKSRTTQIEEILNLASETHGPKLLFGDLNTEPTSPEYKELLAEDQFKDVFSGIENAETFPINNPEKRIDYIFASPDVAFDDQEVIQSNASDHLPIRSEVTFYR